MTYCCENIKRAYELMGDAKNTLNWSPAEAGIGDAVAGFFTANISSVVKLGNYLDEALRRMNNTHNNLCDARNAINICSCGSEKNSIRQNASNLGEKASSLVREYERLKESYDELFDNYKKLAGSSVNKESAEKILNSNEERYNRLWGEYSKNIDDYNRLVNNSVKKEAFERLENDYKKNIKDYNELVGEQKTLVERAKNLQEKYNKLVDEYNDKVTDYQDMKERYEDTNEKLHGEKLRHANEMGNEKLKHKDKDSVSDRKIARLEEKLEASNAQNIDLKKRLESGEKRVLLLENKLDEKSSQLIALRIESGEKDNRIKLKESELEKKDEEIERLKSQAKNSSKQAEKSHEDLLNERIRSERGNLELLANELKINLERIHSLTKYHERLFVARKTHNQANIDVHERNISQVKQELTNQKISVVHSQEICRKCERISELRWELEQSQNQYEARQEVPPRNIKNQSF